MQTIVEHGLDVELLEELSILRADRSSLDLWPGEQLEILGEEGVLADVIPKAFGGEDVAPVTLLARYEAIAQTCLETAFVLTQRNGACQRIAASENAALKERVLPRLATGELFTTVGISHLTTSRQHLKRPAVVANKVDGGWRFEGVAPWVSGACHADFVVTGGVVPGGMQVLGLVHMDSAAVTVAPSADLLGFTSSETASVAINGSTVADEDVLAGPTERVLHAVKVGGTGSLTTSALALGAAAASIAGIASESDGRPELESPGRRLAHEMSQLRRSMYDAARGRADGAGAINRLRGAANSLAIRSATAWLAVSKGTGYVTGHPAERAVREAMFFLVWSCPRSVVMTNLQELATPAEHMR